MRCRPSPLAVSLLALVLSTAACGDDEGGLADARVIDARVGDAQTGAPDAGGSGAVCGGFTGATCEAGEYCDYADNGCGAADGAGTCRAGPAGPCTREYAPVCGCDGEVYGNLCEAHAAGVDVSAWGGCEAPAGMFACGERFCHPDYSYCERQVSDVAGLPDGYQCPGLPAACGDPPDCACLAGEACGAMCDEIDGGLLLTCPGG